MFYLLYFLTLHHYFKKRKDTKEKKRTPHLPPQFCIIEVHLLYTITTTIFSCFRQMKKKIKKKTLIYITLVRVFFWQFCLSSRLLNRVWKAWPLLKRNQQERKNMKKNRHVLFLEVKNWKFCFFFAVSSFTLKNWKRFCPSQKRPKKQKFGDHNFPTFFWQRNNLTLVKLFVILSRLF